MDDKIQEPIVPQDQQTPPADYSHDDISKESLRDIASNTELPKEEVEAVKEEIIDAIPVEDKTQEIAEAAAQAVLDKQKEDAAKVEPVVESTPEEKQYEEWAERYAKETGEAPTYLEAMKFVKDQAVAEIRKDQEAKIEADNARIEAERKEQEAVTEAGWKIINNELDELYSHNVLTKIIDPNNPSDQGLVERNELLNQMALMNEKRRVEGKDAILSVTQFHNFYYKKPTVQPAGADLPISGNRGSSTTPADEQNYSYEDLKKPWSFFKKAS